MSRAVQLGLVFICGALFVGLGEKAFFQDPSDLEKAMHAYLIAHPEVLREMSAKLMEKDQTDRQVKFEQALPDIRDQLTAPDQQATAGNPKGDVTIVEFYDVECPYCKALAPDLERLVKDDEHIRVVYREYPILGEMSTVGARAEIAAEKQGLYEKFHTAMMADHTPEHQLTEKHIFDLAEAAGLNMARLKSDMADASVEARIAANKADAAKLAISGTPGLIFLGPQNKENYLSAGIMSYDQMKAKLAELRLAARG